MAGQVVLTSGNIMGQLLRLSIPLLMGNILQQLYNIINSIVVSAHLGEDALAALGIAESIMNLFLFVISGACLGASVLIVLGIIDDIKALPASFKLVVQIIAALIPALNGVRAYNIANPFVSYDYIHLGAFAIPFTVIWIVGIINAVNFIDGLDGLAVGISSIASFSLLIIAAMVSESYVVIIMAALAGSCIGFMPFNMNPAKIFMGDTGSMFLGYILAVMSVQGMFKFYAVVTFAVPFIILGLPILDTAFAIIRRLMKGQSPFAADRGHVHHRLIDMGFDQKQTVAILYALSAVLGLSAVLLTTSGEAKFIILVLAVAIAVFFGLTVFAYDVKKEREQEKDKNDDKKD